VKIEKRKSGELQIFLKARTQSTIRALWGGEEPQKTEQAPTKRGGMSKDEPRETQGGREEVSVREAARGESQKKALSVEERAGWESTINSRERSRHKLINPTVFEG